MGIDSTHPSPGTSLDDGRGVHRLVVVGGPSRASVGIAVPITGAGVEIGRAPRPGKSIVLDDNEASRAHARVELDADGLVVVDLGSRNGTYLNGGRIERAEIDAGDVLRIGAHLLVVDYTTAGQARALLGGASVETELVGRSLRLKAVVQAIGRAAKLDAPVLILGPSGAGKELVASELHRLSGRAGRFIPVNCAALPEQLAESELFGHEKGAFTGAARASAGLFAEADGGTIFLDEIGEMPPTLQAKLLRTLATGEVRPVGATELSHVDTRVVAATNVDLEKAIDEGGFRGDLFSRLIAVVIRVPGLAERKEDVLALAEHFLAEASPGTTLTSDAMEALLLYRWRFNVRELKQTIEVAAASVRGTLDLVDLPERFHAPFRGRHDDGPARESALPLELAVPPGTRPDAEGLLRVATELSGNVSRIAEYFGRSRRQIHRWAEQHGIDLAELAK